MPTHSQTITLNDQDKETILAIVYQTFKELDWLILFAGEEKILGNTPKSWKTPGQQILAGYENGELTVTSDMVNGESFDLGGKNKKNVATFLAAFEKAKNTITISTIDENITAINILRETTLKVSAEEKAAAEEVDKAMNLSGSNLYATYAIIVINLLVFALMAFDGAGIMEANGLVHVRWGSNFSVLTLSGDWWRLLSNIFLHFGIIHLFMNMYCLYTIGVYLEPMLGKVKYITAYLCTGVLASVASLWWHSEGVNSAGASGAIFGLYGLFLALLTTSLIPKQVRNALLQSIVIFVIYNLAYGMKSGVDNAAHVGGLVSGFVIGYIYVLGIKKEKQGEKLQWILPLVTMLTIAISLGYLQQNKVPIAQRMSELAVIESTKFKDYEKFTALLNEFAVTEEKALAPISDTSLTDMALKLQIDSISYPAWDLAAANLKRAQSFDLSEASHAKANKLLEYVDLRKQELDVLLKMIKTGEQESLIPALSKIRKKINEVVAEIQ